MSDPERSYITSPICDSDLQHFRGSIQQYDVLTSAADLDVFMRQCVSNRMIHDKPIPADFDEDEGPDHSPEYDVLRIADYQMFDSIDEIIVHPRDEIAMDDASVPAWPRGETCKVLFITKFLGPSAEWPLAFLWRPNSESAGFYLPYLPADPDDLGDQENGPLIFWAQILGELKQGQKIAMQPEKSWGPGDGIEEFENAFMVLVKFFSGQRVYEEGEGEEALAENRE